MNVAVTTMNPVKIRAVEAVFAEVFADTMIEIQQLPLNLGLPEQPMDDAIAVGAIWRAEVAQQRAGADFGVGIEAGLMKVPGSERWVSVQFCAIADRTGKCSIGMGPGYELPKAICDAVLAGEPLRAAFERLLDVDDPDRRGAIYFLSNKTTTRMDLTIQAVRMALIPWLDGRGG